MLNQRVMGVLWHAPSNSKNSIKRKLLKFITRHHVAFYTTATFRSSTFNFILGESSKPKKRPGDAKRIALYKKLNRKLTGEDSYFHANVGKTGEIAFGIADGVGGWDELGIDSSNFSHKLTDLMEEIAEKSPDVISPTSLLSEAFDKMEKSADKSNKTLRAPDNAVIAGGSTACVAVSSKDSLNTANLGDSGYIIFRKGKVFVHYDPQTHFFNAPYQLSITPHEISKLYDHSGSEALSDKPEDAIKKTHKLMHGDVAVFATDGLYDNLKIEKITQCVIKSMQDSQNWLPIKDKKNSKQDKDNLQYEVSEKLDPQVAVNIAQVLVDNAYSASISPKVDSPFAREAQAHAIPYYGGKPDDITVIVLLVENASNGKILNDNDTKSPEE